MFRQRSVPSVWGEMDRLQREINRLFEDFDLYRHLPKSGPAKSRKIEVKALVPKKICVAFCPASGKKPRFFF